MPLTKKTKFGIVAVLLCCGAIIAIAVALAATQKDKDRKENLDLVGSDLECAASQTDKSLCENSGCVWNDKPANGISKCTLPMDSKFGYVFDKKEKENEILLKVNKGSFFGKDFKAVKMTVTSINPNVLRVKFEDTSNFRYQVPVPLNDKFPTPSQDSLSYEFRHQNNSDGLFAFSVSRKNNGTVMFDNSLGSLFLADRHIEITTKLPTINIYGIGENPHTTFRHNLTYRKWPVFSRDQFPVPELGDINLYGVHPYYTCLEEDGKSHGVLFLNSNAMEFILTPNPSLTFRAAGGILDMLFFVGDNPEHVVQLYTEVIGRPMIPPYWSLGFQLSRYNYSTLDNLKNAIQRTREKQIPLDVVHADIDHMEDNKDFTWDKERFKDFPEFVKNEKTNGLRVIIILDPALLANDTYSPYKEGQDQDVFIKWPNYISKSARFDPPGVDTTKNVIYGRVWPLGPVVFPDYFKPAARDWWHRNIVEYRKEVDFDAIWIDMNEPSVFSTNQETSWACRPEEKECWTLKCPEIKYDSLENTFLPAAASIHKVTRLSDKTLCMTSIQGETGQYNHYDVHSLYGWSQTESTYNALKASAHEDQVPLVISRSTYPSSGKHTGHWLGDNRSTWDDLRYSIIGMLEFNLFGIPYVGADICGFFQNTTSELCGRWMQLGAFYPFCRNHNNNEALDQDPGNHKMLTDSDIERGRFALETRYQLLPYLYTLHYLAHVQGSTVVRPLFHEFPKDVETYDIQEQFLWGPNLLISPVLYEKQEELKYYIPEDTWYDFYQGTAVNKTQVGNWLFTKDIEKVLLHVRGGCILPLKEKGALNTEQSRIKDFEIRVYPVNSTAKGTLFWMAKNSKDADDKNSYATYDFEYLSNRLTIKPTSSVKLSSDKMNIGSVVIYDVKENPKAMKYENVLTDKFTHDSNKKILTVQEPINLLEINDVAVLEWEF